MCQPKGVRFSTKPAPRAIIRRINAPTGIPRIFPPISSKPVLPISLFPTKLGNVAPLERSIAKPRATYIIPKVAINGATLNLVITKPFIMPINAPITITIVTIIGTLKKILQLNNSSVKPSLIKPPAIIPPRPTIAPTERSIPPVMIT